MTDVHIVGVGIHPFGRYPDKSASDLGSYAIRQALADAGLEWKQVQFLFGGSHDGGTVDALLPKLGRTGIPAINVSNACATGGSSLASAVASIRSGQFDLGVAVGFDKHERGAFNLDPQAFGLPSWYAENGFMLTTQFFAMKIKRYMHLHGIAPRTLGLVAEKAYSNGAIAPHAWRRMAIPLDEIMNSTMLSDPLTKYMFCSPCEGGVALVLASDSKMRQLGLKGPRLRAAIVRSRREGSFEVFSPFLPAHSDASPVVDASQCAFKEAGVSPKEISVAQIQDTEAGAEVMHLAENGFCEDGEQNMIIERGDTKIGGRLPVNTDGGCLACGEPIGASGLRQVLEVVHQLRGTAEGRQVEHARLGYTQVYGAPGVAAVTIVER